MWPALTSIFASSPFEQFNKLGLSETKHTPDLLKLTQYKFQLLFVADEMQQNHRKNHLVYENGAHLCAALTQERYALFKHDLGKQSSSFMLEKRFHTVKSLPVFGELWAVRPLQFLQLDKYKENLVSSYRKRITLSVPYRALYYIHGDLDTSEWRSQKIRAWAYIGRPDYYDPILDNGALHKPCNYYSPNQTFTEDYYAFRTKEYRD